MHLNAGIATSDSNATTARPIADKLRRECRRLVKDLSPSNLWRESLRLRHHLKLHYDWLLRPHTPYQSFFVLATARSGSNLVVDYLNRLPNVRSEWEVLCRDMPGGPRRKNLPRESAIRHVRYSLQSLRAPIRGCKFLLYQLANHNLTLNELDSAFPNSKFIVLYRQSLVDQYLSFQSAVETNQWVLFKGQKPRAARVTVDTADLRRYCDSMRQDYCNLLAQPALLGRSTILSYEELTESPARCLREKICPLLGVPFAEPETKLCKQNPQPLADRVTNYPQIADLVSSAVCWQQYHVPICSQRRVA